MNQKAVVIADRADFDTIIQQITDYVLEKDVSQSRLAMETARYCFMDSVACALMALKYPACTKLLGPCVPNATMPNGGAKVPGTSYQLDPIQAAFNFGAMIRWLDFNDTWLAQEWGHPSDNLGAILMVADYISRQRLANHQPTLTMKHVLESMIKAYEIQGVLALDNSFNQVGLDHVLLVRIASTATVCQLLGASREQTLNAVSHAWLDGSALRTYRHAPNTGSRKSWAAGDATSRAIKLALFCQTGEIGYPSALSAPIWGFQDVSFKSNRITMQRQLSSYVMENVLFKISFPAEFHAQTAVEVAITLHQQIKNKLNDIDRIVIETQQSGNRIINKTGKLNNPADRDHCMQYMVAIGLMKGSLTATDYEDDVANIPLVDDLRYKMQVNENNIFSKDYLDQDKRSIANAIQIFFKDGSATNRVEVHYPIGHKFRRDEGIPLLIEKFNHALAKSDIQADNIKRFSDKCNHQAQFESTPVNEMVDWLCI